MRQERLNRNNRKLVNSTIFEAIKLNPLNENFLKEYDSKSFISKFILKNSFNIFILNNNIGYIWHETLANNIINIRSLYFSPNFLDLPIDFFKRNRNYNYESIANEESISLLKALDFNIYSESYILEKNIKKINFENLVNISFKEIKSKTDINTRVMLQNSIFAEDTRIPLEVSDILFDMKQDYYIDDLAIIMYYKEIPIGYGQIIKNNDYMVVNFGILAEYRNKGFGKHFLNYLIFLSKNKNINKLSIRVSPDNVRALNLYHSLGFYYKEHVLNWNK